jgi:hypothetical protein
MPCFLASFSNLNHGSAILMPNSLASLERATATPSLLDNTTTGLPSSFGLNTRSQET